MDQKLKTIVCIIADITFTIAAIILAYASGYQVGTYDANKNNTYDQAVVATPNIEGKTNYDGIQVALQGTTPINFKDGTGRAIVVSNETDNYINMWSPYVNSYVKNFTVTVYSNEEINFDDITISYYDGQFVKLGNLVVDSCVVIKDTDVVVDNGYTYQKVIQFNNYMNNVQVRANFSQDIKIDASTLVVNNIE